jgi:hypothetical protein
VKLFDGGGLFLLVRKSGGKLWRFKYRFDGKEKLLSFGAYPEITLLNARLKREEARQQIADGIPLLLNRSKLTINHRKPLSKFPVNGMNGFLLNGRKKPLKRFLANWNSMFFLSLATSQL